MSNYGGADSPPPDVFSDCYAICIVFKALFQDGEADESVSFGSDDYIGLP